MVLKGEFVPIYAQWKYGEGMVGSFMCDLNNVWSADFMADATGRRLLMNIINALFPTQNIRPLDIDVELREQNYTTQASIYTEMGKGETIELEIASRDASGMLNNKRIINPTEEEGYSRITFAITEPGVHKLTIRKKDAQGAVLAESVVYKTFSYSQEYNMFLDPQVGEDLLTSLSVSGGGKMIDSSEEIYMEIARTLQHTYDPRIPFIIIALVLFLADIAVRKFKFKWPHEIIRDAKAKKKLQQKVSEMIK